MASKHGSGMVTDLKKKFDIPDYKALYIMYKYIPEFIGISDKSKDKVVIDSFETMKKRYSVFQDYMTEEVLESYLIMDEKMKQAERWLLSKLHQKKQIELYLKLYKDGLNSGEVKSIKEFKDFSESFFKDEMESEVSQFMRNLDLSGIESNE